MTDKERMIEAMKTIKEICEKDLVDCSDDGCPYWYYCGRPEPMNWKVKE